MFIQRHYPARQVSQNGVQLEGVFGVKAKIVEDNKWVLVALCGYQYHVPRLIVPNSFLDWASNEDSAEIVSAQFKFKPPIIEITIQFVHFSTADLFYSNFKKPENEIIVRKES